MPLLACDTYLGSVLDFNNHQQCPPIALVMLWQFCKIEVGNVAAVECTPYAVIAFENSVNYDLARLDT